MWTEKIMNELSFRLIQVKEYGQVGPTGQQN